MPVKQSSILNKFIEKMDQAQQQEREIESIENTNEKVEKIKQVIVTAIDAVLSYQDSIDNKKIILPELEIASLFFISKNIFLLKYEMKLSTYQSTYGDEAIKLELYIKQRASLLEDCRRSRKLNGEPRNLIINVQEDPLHRVIDWKALGNYRQELNSIQRKVERHLAQDPVVKTFNLLLTNFADKLKNKPTPVLQQDSFPMAATVPADTSIKDFYAIDRVLYYLELSSSVVLNTENELNSYVIERALQVVGEYIKSTKNSPHISEELEISIKSLGIPYERITSLRNILSHSGLFSFEVREKFKQKKIAVFKGIQRDLKKMIPPFAKLLYRKELNQIKDRIKTIEFNDVTSDLGSIRHSLQNTISMQSLEEIENALHSVSEQMQLSADQFLRNKKSLIDDIILNIQLKKTRKMITEFESIKLASDDFPKMIEEIKHRFTSDAENLLAFLKKNRVTPSKSTITAISETKNIEHFSLVTKGIAPFNKEDKSEVLYDYFIEDVFRGYLSLYKAIQSKLGSELFMVEFDSEVGVNDDYALLRKPEQKSELDLLRAKFELINHLSRDKAPLIKLLTVLHKENLDYDAIHQFSKLSALDANSGNLLVDLLQQVHQTIQFYQSIQPEEIFDDYFNGFVEKTKSFLNNAEYERFSHAVDDKKKLHQVRLNLLAYCDDEKVITEEEYKEYIKVIESYAKQSISPKNEKFPLKKKGKDQLKKNLQGGIKDSYYSILKAIKEKEKASDINKSFVIFIDALELDFSTDRLKEIAKDYVVSCFETLFYKKIQDLNSINQAYSNGESKGHYDKNIKIANEMLLLDISNIWVSLASMYKRSSSQIARIGPEISLLLDISPVKGFVLRNYLAHGDALVDVLRPDLLPKLMHNIPKLIEDSPFLLKLLHLLDDDAFLARDYLLEIASDNHKLADFSAKTLTIPAQLSKYSDDIQQLQQWSRCREYLAGLAADKISSLSSSSMTRLQYRDRVSDIVNSELREAVAQSDLEKIEYCFASDLVDITATDELGWNLGFFALEGQNRAVFDLLKQKNVKLELVDKTLGSPIHYLILQHQENNFSLLDVFLENNPDALQATNKQGFKASHFAAIKGDVSLLKKIQARGISINERTDTAWTPLLLAIVFDHTPSVDFLITHLKQAGQFDPKTDLMLQGKEAMTGLYLAITNNNPEMLKLLLKHGAKIDRTNIIAGSSSITGGFAPLHRTVHDNNEPLTRILLDNNADVNVYTQGEDKITPLHIAAWKGYPNIVDILFLQKNIHINVQDEEGKSPFSFAIANRHHDLVKKFLALRNGAGERRVDINVKDNLGNTPVYQAVRAGDISTLNLLLSEEGLDINVRNLQGWLPSFAAVAQGRLDMLKALKDKGADLSLKIRDEGTHLQLAKQRGYPTIVEYLLMESKEAILAENKKISNVLKSSAVELSALDFAALIGDNDAIGILIEGGANLFAKNNSGSVLHKAIFSPDPANTLDFIIRKMKEQSLKSYKEIINAKDSGGHTALLYAIQFDRSDAVNVLLAGGADPILKNNAGKNELAIATCLPGPSTARRRKRNVLEGCEISWKDVEKFSEEQVREFHEIKINSAEFLAYYQDPLHSEIKREQLLQLAEQAPVIGFAKEKVTALVNQQKTLKYLQKVGSISGLAMKGMLAKNILRDFLQHNYEGVAINVGFFSGGIFAEKMAGVAAKAGEKFIAEGANFARAEMRLAAEAHLMLGQSLKLSAPFLARAVSVVIVYDLVNQIKAYKEGNPDALVGVVGDSVILTADGVALGVETAEIFGLLAGVSAYTGPIGATIGAVVFVGTDIYLSVKQVNKEDALIHLSSTEKLTEVFRSFIGMRPESHIEKLVEEKQGNNKLFAQHIDYLKKNTNIQRYIAPTAKIVGEVCHTIKYKPPCVVSGVVGMMEYCPPSKLKTECSSKLGTNLDSTVLLDYKRNDFKWSRAKPDAAQGNLFCAPAGSDEKVPGNGAYFCDKAMGIEYAEARTGNVTLVELGDGNDVMTGFPYSDHVVILGDGDKNITLGKGNDIFSLRGNQATGFLDAGEGINRLDLQFYAQNAEVLYFDYEYHAKPVNHVIQIVKVGSFADERTSHTFYISIEYPTNRHQYSSKMLYATRINDVLLRKNKMDVVRVVDCNTRYIDSGGGLSSVYPDKIEIFREANCTYDNQIVIRSFTDIENYALKSGSQFTYIVSGGNQARETTANVLINAGLHQFLFNYTLYDLKGLERDGNTTRFSFIEGANSQTKTNQHNLPVFKLRVIGNTDNTLYRLQDDTEIKIGATGIYALQLTNNSVAEIINAYPRIAANLDLSIFVQSQLTNETIAIGHGKHDVLPNDPYRRSHLIGNGGENIFVIKSGYEVLDKDKLPIPEVALYDVDAENLIDTLDLREIRTQLEKDLELTLQTRIVLQDKDIMVELFSLTNSIESLVAIRLKDASVTHWHKRLHILNPLAMELDALELKPIPLEFGSDKDIIIISPEDVEKNTKLIISKTSGNYYFIRLDNNLLITNALDSNVTAAERYVLSLQRFYQEPKLKTLLIRFLDKEMKLEDEQVNIENAGNYNEVYEQYNRTTHNWIFGKNVPGEAVMPFRFGHYKASNQLVMESVPRYAPLIGHPNKEANAWEQLSNYISWSALLAGGASFVSGALLVGGYFGYRNRLSRTRRTYLPVSSISSSSQALATTAIPLLTMGNNANAQAAVSQKSEFGESTFSLTKAVKYEQPTLKEAGNQNAFKKAKDLKIMVDGNITGNTYLAKWLFHLFGKRAVVNRMNKAEQILARNNHSMFQLDCIQEQLQQGIDTYGSKEEKIGFKNHQKNRTITSPVTIVSERGLVRKDTTSGFLQLPSTLSNLQVNRNNSSLRATSVCQR